MQERPNRFYKKRPNRFTREEKILLNKRLEFMAIALVLSLVAAACSSGGDGGDGGGGGATAGDVKKGGTFRSEFTSFEFTGGLDPTGEYLSFSFALHSNLMHRNLINYKHIAGAAGNELVPDLAEEMPQISEDGLTYTFDIKKGIKWAPPVDREIVCDDFAYEFGRIDVASVVAQYGSYYDGTIVGMDEPTDGPLKVPSGVKCLNDKKIEFTLTKPTGDFLYRLAMPAAAPMPEEVAKCFTKAGEYGRYQVSSGPYMLEGLDDLDISSCNSMKPVSGYEPGKTLTLVRNPNYDPATDSPEVRENLPDTFEFAVNTNEKDIFNKIEAGELEDTSEGPPGELLRKYSTDPELKENLHINSGDRTWYMTMNLVIPPFDDIHVRKAANLVLDKEAIRRAWGGELTGEIATHILPPDVTGGHPDSTEYAPYNEGFSGDVEAAKEEMKQSKYDSDGDGVCDAPECENILHVTRGESPFSEMVPIIEDNFGDIGLKLKTRELADAYPVVSTVARNLPVSSYPGWGKDYPDAYTFVGFLFQGDNKILCEGNFNYSLVGITPERLNECGGEGDASNVPAVDADIAKCIDLLDEERLNCWIELDRKLMEEVVPWVPYLWEQNIALTGPSVTKWEFDQFSGETAYAHVAVDPAAQK